ncbi:Heparanase [Pseudolycoriella hygida]|uniref:Heparanase n=1 Tax=Pseudolycoriella hygida TaxID=35572 RepID=A0A9Q0MVM4_9DIPT|nr:Heparanase [Pseudolycoriella hygida]KAJ6637944.1 Heparanase [Pseudolycoriella hygida]
MYQQISISSIFLSLLIYSNYAEEVLIQIVVKKPINTVSDRYVSFSMDPGHLLDLYLTPNKLASTTILAQNLGSAYIKINGGKSTEFTLDDKSIPSKLNQIRILPADWQALHQWIKKTNLKAIVTLPYSSTDWSPRNVMNILGISHRLGVSDCLWQLGSELNSTNTIIDYVDDLSTFKTIVDTFRKNGRHWDVKGADITTGCKVDEAHLYAELSKHISVANGWTQSMDYNSPENDATKFFHTDPTLRSLLRTRVPVWLNVPQTFQSSTSAFCLRECELRGIHWANILGVSAQNGFKVVFQNIDKSEVMNPSLSYYVSLLHKKIMGGKVFDTKVLNGNSLSPKFFTHCTRNVSGSFSVMGVNPADYKTTISTKLPSKYTGLQVYKYVLNVQDGQISFNGIRVNISTELHPIVKIKKPNRLTTFTLPPRSVGFWVFPLANLKQCSIPFDTNNVPSESDFELSPRTASEKLLQELISEIVQIDETKNEIKRTKRHAVVKKDSKHMHRVKRNANPGYETRRAATLFKKFSDEAAKKSFGPLTQPKLRVRRQINSLNINNNYNNRFNNLFKTFDLPQPTKLRMAKFWNLPPPTQKTLQQNPEAIPPVTSTIHDVYSVHPSEQIFKSAENPELPTGDVFFEVGEERNMDYVEFDGKSDKLTQSQQQHTKTAVDEKFVDVDAAQGPAGVPDHMQDFYMKAKGTKLTTPEISPYSELWESDAYQKPPPPQSDDNNRFIGQPHNPEQNIDLIVKELPPTWRQNKENLMKAKNSLNSIYMSDGDRASSINVNLPTRQYDMDEDGFFVSKRKKRSISSNLNDEIENKVNNLKKEKVTNNKEVADEYEDVLSKTGDKIHFLEKITKIVESLEKIDDIGKYKNIDKLTSDIKELENFLLKKNAKLGVLKPKTKNTRKEIRRKCKILSVNLEHQCLKENDFYPSRLINLPSKNSKSPSRVRRQTMISPSSWENDNPNLILKEIYSANEFNDFVPSISFKRSMPYDDRDDDEREGYVEKVSVLQRLPESFNSDKVIQVAVERGPDPVAINLEDEAINNGLDEDEEFVEKVAVLQSLPESFISEKIMQVAGAETPVPLSTDTNLGDQVIIDGVEENEKVQEYETPKFMKKISNSVQDWMNVVERHVSGWWHLMS